MKTRNNPAIQNRNSKKEGTLHMMIYQENKLHFHHYHYHYFCRYNTFHHLKPTTTTLWTTSIWYTASKLTLKITIPEATFNYLIWAHRDHGTEQLQQHTIASSRSLGRITDQMPPKITATSHIHEGPEPRLYHSAKLQPQKN